MAQLTSTSNPEQEIVVAETSVGSVTVRLVRTKG